MKRAKRILIAVVVVVFFTPVIHVRAQYRALGDDGTAASPKLRQMLHEGRMVPSGTADTFVVIASPADGVVASPKLRQVLDERKTVPTLAGEGKAIVSYQAVNDQGIVASPKLQEQLSGRAPAFQIAPIK